MPVYLYRREDGTTFEYRQKFLDEPLTVDPETGQQVVRVVQPTGVIFKGTGFYVTDSKNASKKSLNGTSNGNGANGNNNKKGAEDTTAKSDTIAKAEKKSETA